MTNGRGLPGLAASLAAFLLGLLLLVGPGSAPPAAHADTPSPPPTASPDDEPVGGGGRTLTWLALAGAGSVALVAGGIVVAAGRRRRPELPAASSATETSVDSALVPPPVLLPGARALPWDDNEPDDDSGDRAEVEVTPRRGMGTIAGTDADGADDADEDLGSHTNGDRPRGRRVRDMDAFHLDDPLTLDTGFRPRRAMHPIPDSSVTVAPAVDDSSWSQWYESSEHPVRRGRRALPPEPDEQGSTGDESTPRRAQLP